MEEVPFSREVHDQDASALKQGSLIPTCNPGVRIHAKSWSLELPLSGLCRKFDYAAEQTKATNRESGLSEKGCAEPWNTILDRTNHLMVQEEFCFLQEFAEHDFLKSSGIPPTQTAMQKGKEQSKSRVRS